MTVHEEYTKIIEERYSGLKNNSYEMKANYLTAFYAPHYYGTEEAVLNYVKENEKATLAEVANYFNEITPSGLAPGDDGSDLLVDDD